MTNVRGKLDYIDALRGWAVLGVIMIHLGQYMDKEFFPNEIVHFIGSGSLGVQLFFFVSAFTLFLSFSRRISKERKPLLNFFIRRFFRIAPLYYIGIVYYLLQNGTVVNYNTISYEVTWLNIISQCLFIHDINPYYINSVVPGGWSIGVEMSFYLIVPLLFKMIKTLNNALTFFFLTLCISLFFRIIQLFVVPAIGADTELWNVFFFFILPNQLPVFAVGIIFFFLQGKVSHVPYKQIGVISILLLANMLLGKNHLIPSHVVFAMLFGCVALVMSKGFFKWSSNRFIQRIGVLSYSMYLVHFAVLYWLNKLSLFSFTSNSLLKSLFFFALFYSVVVVLSILISNITDSIIEKPFQRLGKRIILRWEGNS